MKLKKHIHLVFFGECEKGYVFSTFDVEIFFTSIQNPSSLAGRVSKN